RRGRAAHGRAPGWGRPAGRPSATPPPPPPRRTASCGGPTTGTSRAMDGAGRHGPHLTAQTTPHKGRPGALSGMHARLARSLRRAPCMPSMSTSSAVEEPLALRRVAIDTYHENVAFLHRDCAVYRAEGFQALSKVEVSVDGSRVLAVLNVVDDAAIVTPAELGLSEQAFAQLGAD